MKSLFKTADNAELINRIHKLTPQSHPLWGKMNVSQMLAHLQAPLHAALGELKSKRGLIGILFGKLAKKKFLSGAPFGKNLPTDKNFIVTDNRDFEIEKQKVIALLHRFEKAGPAGITKEPHPFFGIMHAHEWDAIQWKHFDHHLSQFGV